jgi:hypothetical protein
MRIPRVIDRFLDRHPVGARRFPEAPQGLFLQRREWEVFLTANTRMVSRVPATAFSLPHLNRAEIHIAGLPPREFWPDDLTHVVDYSLRQLETHMGVRTHIASRVDDRATYLWFCATPETMAIVGMCIVSISGQPDRPDCLSSIWFCPAFRTPDILEASLPFLFSQHPNLMVNCPVTPPYLQKVLECHPEVKTVIDPNERCMERNEDHGLRLVTKDVTRAPEDDDAGAR